MLHCDREWELLRWELIGGDASEGLADGCIWVEST